MRFCLLALPLLGMQMAVTITPANAASRTEQALLDLEQQRLNAQVAKDIDALAASIAPDAIYIHANGAVQTGTEFLKSVEAGGSRYRSIEVEDRGAMIRGDTALTHGKIILNVGVDRRIEARYTGVYVRQKGKWVVISWQSTPIAAQ